MGAPIVHFEINAKDSKRAAQFYGSLFKWDINANNPMNYGIVKTGSKKGIEGGIGQVDRNKAPYTTFYIEVDDPQRYLDRVVSLGGKIIAPVMEIPDMVTFAQFADPEGNVIGLVKSQMPKKKINKIGKTPKIRRK